MMVCVCASGGVQDAFTGEDARQEGVKETVPEKAQDRQDQPSKATTDNTSKVRTTDKTKTTTTSKMKSKRKSESKS